MIKSEIFLRDFHNWIHGESTRRDIEELLRAIHAKLDAMDAKVVDSVEAVVEKVKRGRKPKLDVSLGPHGVRAAIVDENNKPIA